MKFELGIDKILKCYFQENVTIGGRNIDEMNHLKSRIFLGELIYESIKTGLPVIFSFNPNKIFCKKGVELSYDKASPQVSSYIQIEIDKNGLEKLIDSSTGFIRGDGLKGEYSVEVYPTYSNLNPYKIQNKQ